MKTIKVDAADLRAALDRAVVEKKTTIPVLTNVMLKPSDNGLRVISTDLDMAVITELDATVSKGTEIMLLPFRVAVDVLKGERGPVTITGLENWWAGINVGETDYKVPGHNPANFPATPEVQGPSFTVSGTGLKTMIDHTSFAISNKEPRYTLNGTLLKLENKELVLCATDGHRLAVEREKVKGVRYKKTIETLVPRAAITWLTKHADESDVEITVGENETAFRLPEIRTTFITRKLRGEFPKYEKVMPERTRIKLTATFPAADALSKSLVRVARMADERSGAVRWTVNGSCVISAQSIETGEAKATPAAQVHHAEGAPEEITIGLDSDYILDFLKAVGKNPVNLMLKDSQSAALLDSPAIPNYSYVVMPMGI